MLKFEGFNRQGGEFQKVLGYNGRILTRRRTMSQPLTMKYTPDQVDYVQVLRIFFLRQTGIRISLGFLAVAFAIILYSVATQAASVSLFQLAWLLLPPLFVVYILYWQPRSMARRAMSNEQLAAETTWLVTDEGVSISSAFGANQLEWDTLTRLITSKDYYLLVFKTEKNFFRFLPRRAFASPQEDELFVQQVTSHLQK
jgi:hypothetical protein